MTQPPRRRLDSIVIIGLALALVGVIVAIAAWLRPQQPKVQLDTYTKPIQTVQDAYDLYGFLVDREGKRVQVKTTVNPGIVPQADPADTTTDSFFVDRGNVQLKDEGDNATAGTQFNLFGLSPTNIENIFGWGGPRGWDFRGTYVVVDSGIGTGGILWIALQARPESD